MELLNDAGLGENAPEGKGANDGDAATPAPHPIARLAAASTPAEVLAALQSISAAVESGVVPLTKSDLIAAAKTKRCENAALWPDAAKRALGAAMGAFRARGGNAVVPWWEERAVSVEEAARGSVWAPVEVVTTAHTCLVETSASLSVFWPATCSFISGTVQGHLAGNRNTAYERIILHKMQLAQEEDPLPVVGRDFKFPLESFAFQVEGEEILHTPDGALRCSKEVRLGTTILVPLKLLDYTHSTLTQVMQFNDAPPHTDSTHCLLVRLYMWSSVQQ